MPNSRLALLGGKPVSSTPWPITNTIGEEEKRAVQEVLDSGTLSGFRAAAGPDFLGGPRVRQLEGAWAEFFGVKHAISFNSLTSGLFAAMGAIGVGPGDEVIVSPFTMVASAICPLIYGGIPVFADIDPATYCLDPESVEARITSRTRAIIVVHLFGCPAEMDRIMAIAKKYDLTVIEDCAQAPAAKYKRKYVGTIGSIGGFSLNYHKTIHSGEGGVLVTDDDELALRLQLIRNHGEASVEELKVTQLVNTFGGNYRMTEVEAAIAHEQLQKLDWLTEARVHLASYLDEHLADLPGITAQKLADSESKHVYYFYPMRYDEEVCGLSRETFVRAIRAEGIELRQGYVRPIYWEPLFQKKIAFDRGFPFVSEWYDGEINYEKGLCPVAEAAHERELIFGGFCRWPLTEVHMDEVVQAFKKVVKYRSELMEVAH